MILILKLHFKQSFLKRRHLNHVVGKTTQFKLKTNENVVNYISTVGRSGSKTLNCVTTKLLTWSIFCLDVLWMSLLCGS